jgi:hypothetical protein
MLQAMGLGGWMFNGMDPFNALGPSGNPRLGDYINREGQFDSSVVP